MLLRYSEYSESLLCRPTEGNEDIEASVKAIIDEVRKGGDKALLDLSERFDGSRPSSLFVSEEEMEEVERMIPAKLRDAIDRARDNIYAFHAAQMPEGEVVETAPGVVCSRKIVPIDRVGLYIPGGTAPLFSTVLMLAVPAKAAGCPDIMLATPCRGDKVNPAILYAARSAGVGRVLRVGGAQAIAAFAYGTESVQSEKTRRFAAALEKAGLAVVFEDERYTTRAAQGDLLTMGVSRRKDKKKKQVDSIAAAYILENYLAKIKKGEPS